MSVHSSFAIGDNGLHVPVLSDFDVFRVVDATIIFGVTIITTTVQLLGLQGGADNTWRALRRQVAYATAWHLTGSHLAARFHLFALGMGWGPVSSILVLAGGFVRWFSWSAGTYESVLLAEWVFLTIAASVFRRDSWVHRWAMDSIRANLSGSFFASVYVLPLLGSLSFRCAWEARLGAGLASSESSTNTSLVTSSINSLGFQALDVEALLRGFQLRATEAISCHEVVWFGLVVIYHTIFT